MQSVLCWYYNHSGVVWIFNEASLRNIDRLLRNIAAILRNIAAILRKRHTHTPAYTHLKGLTYNELRILYYQCLGEQARQDKVLL